MTWGIKHVAMATIYKGAILPLLIYGAPVWIEAMNHEHNRRKYRRVRRLIDIRMAKAYRTTSSAALCMLTATTPIIIKLEGFVKRYNTKRGKAIVQWNWTVKWNINTGRIRQTQ